MSKKIIFVLMLLLFFTKSLSAEALLNTHHLSAAQILGIGTSREGTLTTNSSTGFFFIGTIMQRKVVEWKTVSKTRPVCDQPHGCLVIHYTILNQVGTKYLVTIAQIEWKGKVKEIELERIPVLPYETLERQISE